MPLTPGTTLGPYEIQAPLGAGGMGEVYKARDTRLDRTVAIKVLPEHVASDPDLKQRFEREAKTISSLNHPHICTLHDIGSQDGIDFLVMEYLEGDTLARRLEKGALPLQQALQVAIEIADALDKAHRQGITHRDLKPGNIMLTKAGAKLLDFGLAKLRKPGTVGDEGFSAATTASAPMTRRGTLLGTLPYMSPEQVEGMSTDSRTDVFAFGAVLYEMLTGRRAFAGSSQADLIASILDREPESIETLRPTCPAALSHVVEACLAKRASDRWQTAVDLCRQLKWIAAPGGERKAGTGSRTESTIRRQVALWAAGVLLGAAAVGLWMWRTAGPASSPVVRFDIAVAESGIGILGRRTLALSPDGRTLVYTAEKDGQLHQRALDQLGATAIGGTENAYLPFFSPEGPWVGFFEQSLTGGTRLKKVRLDRGSAVTLREDLGFVSGASWGPEDRIVFGGREDSALWQMSAEGGEPERITTVDTAAGESAHVWPEWLPDGRAILFSVIVGDPGTEQIAVASVGTGQHHYLIDGRAPRYVDTGHLFYEYRSSLWRVPFDVETLQLAGEAVPLLEGIREGLRSPSFALSADGSLAYFPESEQAESPRALVWVDQRGAEEEIALGADSYIWPRVSPDGSQVAIWIQGNSDLWINDPDRGTLSKLTTDDGADVTPLWHPSGDRVVFQSTRDPPGIYSKSADGTGAADLLMENEGWTFVAPMSWSADGQTLVFQYWSSETLGNIGILPIGGAQEWEPLLATPAIELAPAVSPDGTWMAYVSDQTGRAEVYVERFPSLGDRRQISLDGGMGPHWSSGGELFYRRRSDGAVMVVRFDRPSGAPIGRPEVAVEGRYFHAVGGPFDHPGYIDYSVTPDGSRFLMLRGEAEPTPTRIIVVQNWTQELLERVPVN